MTCLRGRRRKKCCQFFKVLMFIFILLVVKKVFKCHRAMNFMRRCRHTVHVSKFKQDESFKQFVKHLKLHQEQGNIRGQCNCKFACPVLSFSIGIVTLDDDSRDIIARERPDLLLLHWPLDCLQGVAFSYGEGPYQLMQMFRASLTAALVGEGLYIWCMQADTFWRENLFKLNFESRADNNDIDILFDQAGAHGISAEMSAGGYMFVRPTNASVQFFQSLSNLLSWWYVPDNTAMAALCWSKTYGIRCGYMPYHTVTGWQWLSSANPATESMPYLFQFDGEEGGVGGKMERMRQNGLMFIDENHCCHYGKCNNAILNRALQRFSWQPRGYRAWSWKEAQLHIFTKIGDFMSAIPIIGYYFKQCIFMASYFMMFTM